MKNINRTLIFIILIVFSSCRENSTKKNNYYNVKDYVVKDSIFNNNQDHELMQINLINKYDSSWKLVRLYWSNGIMAAQGFFHQNKKDGPFITTYPQTSKIMGVGYYKNSLLDGKLTIYFEDGKINKIRYYKNGKKVGAWKTFDSTGHLIDSTIYE